MSAGRLDPAAKEDANVGVPKPQGSKATSSNKISTPADTLPGLSRPENFPPLVAPQPNPSIRVRPTAISASAATKIMIPANETQHVRSAAFKGPIKGNHSPLDVASNPNLPDQSIKSAKTSSYEKPGGLTPSQHVAESDMMKLDSDQNVQSNSIQPTRNKEEEIQDKASRSVRKTERLSKLDIAAINRNTQDATDRILVASKLDMPDTPKKSQGEPHTTLAVSQPATPVTASSVLSSLSTARQVQRRTMRVLPSSKIETPSLASASSPLVSHAEKSPSLRQEPSRQPSLASINRPATPASEKISDNASMTSTALSRANSPGPGRVGSAPLRQTTKSQQKKERQAKAKLAEESEKIGEMYVKVAIEEPVHAPIIGRKKKAKKTTGITDEATPLDSRAPSPGPGLQDVEIPTKDQGATSDPIKNSQTSAEKGRKQEEILAKDNDIVPESGEERPSKASITAASIYAELQKAARISSSVPELFRNVPGLNHRFDISQNDLGDLENDDLPVLSEEQMRRLNSNQPISADTAPGKRVIILPNRRVIKNLNKQQIDRYLALRKESITTPVMFSAQRKDIDSYLPKAVLSAAGSEDGQKVPTAYPFSESRTDLMYDHFAMKTPQSAPFSEGFPGSGVTAPTDDCSSTRESFTSVEQAEQLLIASRKETEALEKRLNGLLKKNGRLLFGRGH